MYGLRVPATRSYVESSSNAHSTKNAPVKSQPPPAKKHKSTNNQYVNDTTKSSNSTNTGISITQPNTVNRNTPSCAANRHMNKFQNMLDTLYGVGNSKSIQPSFLTTKQLFYIQSQKIYQLSTGALYRGEWQNKHACGIGEKLIHSNGIIRRHIGYFIDAKSHGESLIDDSNALYIGQCVNDCEHGHGVQTMKSTGDIIEGEWCDGVPVSGILKFSDTTVFTGTFANSQPSRGKFMYSKKLSVIHGIKTYDGELLNGEPHGRGTAVYEDGFIYSGNWSHGKPSNTSDGIIQLTPCSDKTIITYYGACKPSARGPTSDCTTGKLVYTNNKLNNGVYTGGILNLKPDGHGTRIYESGDRYTGEYKLGSEHGYGEWLEISGGDTSYMHYRGYWKHNIEHGPAELIYHLTSIGRVKMITTMKQSKAEGYAVIYYNRYGSKHEDELIDVLYQGNMHAGEYHGYGTLIHPDKWMYRYVYTIILIQLYMR